MFWRKSILMKIMIGIILPVVVMLAVAGTGIISTLKETIYTAADNQLLSNSKIAST